MVGSGAVVANGPNSKQQIIREKVIISGKNFLYRLENRRDLHLSQEDLLRIEIVQVFFFPPIYSQIFWILLDGTCITNVLSTNQNECKESAK